MQPQTENPPHKPVILLVDDEEAVRQTMARWLERSGYEVKVAENGVDAMGYAMWPGHHVDLVITDVDMPRLGGPHFIQQLHEELPSVPVLYVSGYPRSIFAFLDADPAIPFLHKPFPLAELADAVQKLIPTTPVPA